MASTSGQTLPSLISQLAQDPARFDFFRAVRLIECHSTDCPRVGYSSSPAQDPVRFGQKPSLAFAPSTLDQLHPNGPGGHPQLLQHFFGLFGPNGPLPLHLTEYARERILHFGDETFAAFCNVFHHRLLCFFYRAWADSQKVVDLDRPQGQRFVDYIGSFLGTGVESLRHQDLVPDWARLFYSGRLACPVHSADALQDILQDFFQLPTLVEPFVGQWLDVPADCRCHLGVSPETSALGTTAIVGARFWDCQLKFRICFGPLRLTDYERMLPDRDSFARLQHWVRSYCDDEYFWETQLILRAEEVPATCLGQAGRLGWTTWLKTEPFTDDADDLVLSPASQ